ncbi:MAG TPA: polysaccharide deacetylase family protein, partial [Bacteroidota bacterium]|nr:polysaccharide deacetylase family protein [Bacteroidota bacterium]
MLRSLSLLVLLLLAAAPLRASDGAPVSVLIVVEGGTSMSSPAIARGRELATLLGHFNATARVLGVNEYVPRTFGRYDLVFFIGFDAVYSPPARFCDDVLASATPVIWMDTGFREFSARPEVRKKYGFTVSHIDSLSVFDEVRAGDRTFTKGEPNINMIEIADRRKVTVTATALSSARHWEVPYIVRSGNLMYIADCPFASATETDRYLLFADMLHDLLRQPHEAQHTALIRIEDVNPLEDPTRLRAIADILAGRNIPFLVGVIPFYVSRSEGVNVSLSDRPDLVDALKYMVANGGTIVMHGVTHQYRGTTAVDYEFWDETTNRPIREETVESIQRKLDTGIQEFMKNGLYPLLWETPHYAASRKLYETVSRYFSTAMEQRLAIEDADAGQYFPYMINRDLYGQRLIPENLGYVPLDPDPAVAEAAVKRIIASANVNLAVRDGFASHFFHAFVDPALLEQIVDGVQALGYTYKDVKEIPAWVKLKDRIILCGSQDYTITLDDQYLEEMTFDRSGEIVATTTSEKRLRGAVTRHVTLEPGEFYTAGPVEFREKSPSLAERVLDGAGRLIDRITGQGESWREARAAICWNQYAEGAAFNDQASFAGVMRSVNIALDTVFVGQRVRTEGINLLFVPYTFVDSMGDEDYDAITRFVREGGNVVTDMPTELSHDLGILSGTTRLSVTRVRDRLYPEERIVWPYAELATKFDAEGIDHVFCVDEATEAPLAVGKSLGKGKVLYFSTRFDPRSREGYSCYPYLLEYIGRYFRLGPVVRRDRLEVYFEPGSRARTMSTEALIQHWVRLGVGALHVSGWHQWSKYTYDYGRLITLAHANGILV